MLSVQSPSPLNMSPTHSAYYNPAWAPWRPASDAQSDLPTPPSSVPPRRTKQQQHSLHQLPHAQAHSEHHSHLTLPPITQLDRRSSWSSPLTPPDDEMHAAPLWRDSKPGPSRLHSPAHATPMHSPTPSPIDEDEDEYSYAEDQDEEDMEEDDEDGGEVEVEADEQRKDGVLYPESEREWQQQQRQLQLAPQQYPDPPPHVADWVISPQKRSAHFIAEKVCEMVCYFWFSSSLGPSAASSRHRRERERERAKRHAAGSSAHTSPNISVGPLSNDRTAMLQFSASPEFVAFLQKLLETTQVSQSVIVLSLHYIYRLKERNDFTVGKQGSEFRVAVVALMLANKFVDDNTYTNKTWSEVSGIALAELNKMEREFLQGVDFRLYVDKSTYDSWLNLLRGLVLAKEREHQRWLSRRRVPSLALPNPHSQYHQPPAQQAQSRIDERRNRGSQPDAIAYATGATQRARSTSPHRSAYSYSAAYPFTFAVPYSSSAATSASTAYSASATPSTLVDTPAYAYSQSARTSPTSSLSSGSGSGSISSMVVDSAAAEARPKRRAADAFSPTSASFGSLPTVHPPKRPTNLAVDIDAALSARAGTANSHSNNAVSVSAQQAYAPFAESLKSLERLSLASAGVGSAPVTPIEPERRQHSHLQQREQTLAAPYRPEDLHRRVVPQNLYFYTLASSPVRPGPIASSVSSGSDAQTDSTGEDFDTEPREENVRYYNAQGAERKARLKYSVAPTSSTSSSSAHHGYAYSYGAAGPYHTSAYTRNTYPPAAATHSAPDAYSQGHQQHGYSTPEQQHTQPQDDRTAYNHTGTHLPPLSSLSLRPAPLVVQSARSSPLPSFRETYGAAAVASPVYAHPQATSAEQRSYAQPSAESTYTPPQQHLQGHYYHPHHAYKPSVPSPLAQQAASSSSSSAPGVKQHAAYTAAPAPFANAGPPGVVHFYQHPQAHPQNGYPTPYTASSSSSSSPSAAAAAYARHAVATAPESPGAVSSGVPCPAPPVPMTMSSPLRALPYAEHQQQTTLSVNANDRAYTYTARGRRY